MTAIGHEPPGGHRPHTDPAELVGLAEYRREVITSIPVLEPIELGLLDALGCVLAEDAVAVGDLPAFANSAMDGYAVRADEVGAGVALPLAGESAAAPGVPLALPHGQALRIMTGAPVPAGADAVVPVERTEERDGQVVFHTGAEPGENVRPAGEDVRAGDVVLRSGRRLGAADVGMLAALGYARVQVRPRPRVVVIATGDELVEPGEPAGHGQLRDSNSFTLTAMAREAGAEAFRHHIVRDDPKALLEAFEGALAHADLLVTSGGVSAGRYDFVKDVLAQLGDVRFRKIGMKPGMPQAFGVVTTEHGHPVPCFGLPGNPVSAFVSFEVFVRPAIRRLQGRADVHRPRIRAVLAEPLRTAAHKVEFVRVALHRESGAWRARPTGAQGSGILRSAVDADGLAEIPADRTTLEAGEPILVHLLAQP